MHRGSAHANPRHHTATRLCIHADSKVILHLFYHRRRPRRCCCCCRCSTAATTAAATATAAAAAAGMVSMAKAAEGKGASALQHGRQLACRWRVDGEPVCSALRQHTTAMQEEAPVKASAYS